MAAYRLAAAQTAALCDGETNTVARLANAASVIKEGLGFFWVGFYIVDPMAGNLVLGPFQGPIACTRIAFGKGVCGTAWKKKAPVVVKDVDQFPGHISCSSLSKSEIVVPVFASDGSGEVRAVLDIDSQKLAEFTDEDAKSLQEITELLKY
jgi:L-methionine (R)-S-oxide reductase